VRRLVLVSCLAIVSAACGQDRPDDTGAVAPQPPGSVSPPGSSGSPPPVAAPVCPGRTAQPTDSTWTVPANGQNRTALVHVPALYDPSTPTPLVLNFHGFTSNGSQEELLTQMNPKADTAGFIAVYPEGLQASWNAGACCGYAAETSVDDIGFVNALLDQLEAQLCVDSHRIYSTGMSNGGFLSHRIGCEISSRVAAIAPVAGVLGVKTCNPTRPVPIMEFHGTLDPLVPYLGDPLLGFPSVPDTFAGWAAHDGCTGQPTQTYDNVDSQCQTYTDCSAGAEVTLCTVQGGGHTWPGGLPIPIGYTTPFLNATDAMWDFFQKHPLP
jgi:polyhydroxybutyrate depolymerase